MPWRTIICGVALAWALLCVHASGNYKSIRRYLWVMAADILIGGVYLSIWPLTGWPYVWVYSGLTAAIATAASMVAWQGMKALPRNYRIYGLVVVAIASMVAVGLQWGFVTDPQSRVTLLAGGVMFPIGILTLCSSLVVDVLHDSAFRTLGLLWSAQGFIFYLIATGAQVFTGPFNSFGQWLPALAFVCGMVALGMDFKDAHLIPAQERNG